MLNNQRQNDIIYCISNEYNLFGKHYLSLPNIMFYKKKYFNHYQHTKSPIILILIKIMFAKDNVYRT